MKKIICILTFLAGVRAYGQEPLKLYQVDPLEKIFKERAFFMEKTDTAYAAAGETVSFQFVVKANTPAAQVQLSMEPLEKGQTALNGKTGWVTYVPVGRSYTPASKDLLHSISGYFPDPIVDDTLLTFTGGEINPLWVSVPVPAATPPGVYKGRLKVGAKVDGKTISTFKEMILKIYPVQIAETSLLVSNWSAHYNPVQMELLNHGQPVSLYSDQYWELVQIHAKIMMAHNQNVIRVYPVWGTDYTLKNGRYGFDFKNFLLKIFCLRESPF